MSSAEKDTRPPFSDSPELNLLVEQYKKLYNMLTPAQKRGFDRDCAIDFAYSNLTCTGRRPEVTREMVAAEYDKRHS